MFCTECGEKLTLMFKADEGLVPYCKKCAEYRFPRFATVVGMVVTNREKDKILLAKHKGGEDYILFAGYIKRDETAEKAVTREFKEETKLDVVKFKYLSSRFHEPKNLPFFAIGHKSLVGFKHQRKLFSAFSAKHNFSSGINVPLSYNFTLYYITY